MAYHVHICCVGTNPDPSLAMTRSGIPIDSVFLLCANENAYSSVNPEMNQKLKQSENKIEFILSENGISSVTKRRVNSWKFQEIIDCILDIAADVEKEHEDVSYHINFTSGTHVMAGAVSCAAFYIGADLYYVLNKKEHPEITAENETQTFIIPFIPDVQKLKGETATVLFMLKENEEISNSTLLDKTQLSPSKLGYHTKVLKQYDLIQQSRQGREVFWSLTFSGKVAVKILKRPLKVNNTN